MLVKDINKNGSTSCIVILLWNVVDDSCKVCNCT